MKKHLLMALALTGVLATSVPALAGGWDGPRRDRGRHRGWVQGMPYGQWKKHRPTIRRRTVIVLPGFGARSAFRHHRFRREERRDRRDFRRFHRWDRSRHSGGYRHSR